MSKKTDKKTVSFYLPEDVADAIARRSEKSSRSQALARIVHRYLGMVEILGDTLNFNDSEWEELLATGFGVSDEHGFGTGPQYRLRGPLREKFKPLTMLQQVAVWDRCEMEIASGRGRKAKKGGKS